MANECTKILCGKDSLATCYDTYCQAGSNNACDSEYIVLEWYSRLNVIYTWLLQDHEGLN